MRIDVWLWAVRMFKSRSAAAAALKKGHVSIDDVKARPASEIKIGQTVKISNPQWPRVLVVKQLLTTRVGYPLAVQAYEDLSPEPLPRQYFAIPQRERGTGRPTKRERRELTKLRGY